MFCRVVVERAVGKTYISPVWKREDGEVILLFFLIVPDET
jgi:hypothetical protein